VIATPCWVFGRSKANELWTVPRFDLQAICVVGKSLRSTITLISTLCRFAIYAITGCGVLLADLACANDAELLARFRSETGQVWSKMIQLADQIDLEYDRNVTMKVKVSQFDSTYTFKSHGKNFLFVSSDILTPLQKDQPPSERQLVFCRNSGLRVSIDAIRSQNGMVSEGSGE